MSQVESALFHNHVSSAFLLMSGAEMENKMKKMLADRNRCLYLLDGLLHEVFSGSLAVFYEAVFVTFTFLYLYNSI